MIEWSYQSPELEVFVNHRKLAKKFECTSCGKIEESRAYMRCAYHKGEIIACSIE